MILTVTLNAAIDKRYVVENYQVGQVNRVKECAYVAGGKGLNVSKQAVIAGGDVLATGFVGGYAGQYIIKELETHKVNADFVSVLGESRSCINIYDEIHKTQTEFLEPGVVIDRTDLQKFIEKYAQLSKECNVIAISGSIPKGLEPTIYQDLVLIGKQQNKPVIVDTSGPLLEAAIQAKPTMIKPNIDEIRMLTGKHITSKEELIAAAQTIQAKGVSIVVVSLGAEGSIFVSKEGTYQATVPKINAVNSVGCGDAMIAGFAVGLEQGMNPQEILRFASAVSTASAMTAETGFFKKEDMEMLLPQIKIKKL